MDMAGLARRTRGDFKRRGGLVFAWQMRALFTETPPELRDERTVPAL